MRNVVNRYSENRFDGADIVSSLAARRVPHELMQWIDDEAHRRKCTKRRLIEDVISDFIHYRKNHPGRPAYENLPRHEGKIFRVFIDMGLLKEAFAIIEQDGVYNGDFVTAALRHAIDKS